MRRVALLLSISVAACGGEVTPRAPSTPGPVNAAVTASATPSAADFTIRTDAIVDREGHVVVALPADREHGAAPEAKRAGRKDQHVVPLVRAFAAKKSESTIPLVDVDPSTPYRVLLELAYSANEAGVRRFEARLYGADRRVSLGPAPATNEGLGLLALVVGDGIGLKARGGNVATGCTDTGSGITVPRRDGRHDFRALSDCARRLKGAAPEFAADRAVRFTANPDVPFSDVLAAMEAMRGEALDLFPDVSLSLPLPTPGR